MAGIARLALVPITLAGAAVPTMAQADAGSTAQSAALLGSVGSMRLYPFAGSQFDPFSNSIEVYIGRLRRIVDRGAAPKLIHTIRGAGYILEAR